jgi:hypothetical protein
MVPYYFYPPPPKPPKPEKWKSAVFYLGGGFMLVCAGLFVVLEMMFGSGSASCECPNFGAWFISMFVLSLGVGLSAFVSLLAWYQSKLKPAVVLLVISFVLALGWVAVAKFGWQFD